MVAPPLTVVGTVLVEGVEPASGPLVPLSAPISLWGGVDPQRGRISDPRHPDRDRLISGSVLAIPAPIGSSSSSAIMLELLREKTAPRAVLLGRADAILALGVVVGRELGYPPIPVVHVSPRDIAKLASHRDARTRVMPDGIVEVVAGI